MGHSVLPVTNLADGASGTELDVVCRIRTRPSAPDPPGTSTFQRQQLVVHDGAGGAPHDS